MVVAQAWGEAEIADGDFVFHIQRVQTAAFALAVCACFGIGFVVFGVVEFIAYVQAMVGAACVEMRGVFERGTHGFNFQLGQPVQAGHMAEALIIFAIVQHGFAAVDFGRQINPIVARRVLIA